MSFLLCHECYAWVEPRGDRCSHCGQIVDPEATDPPLSTLAAAIGDLRHLVGEIRVRRKRLPELGLLYATSQGLLFVPHRTVYAMQTVEGQGAGASLFWTLATAVWSPLMLVAPFVRTRRTQEQAVPVADPQYLEPDDSSRLPELLMEDPGVFYIPRRTIRSLRRRRHTWTVERALATPLKFRAEGDRALFHRQMTELLRSPLWRGLVLV